MEGMTRPRPEDLRDFVRHALGCGCPDEVLEDIRYTPPRLVGAHEPGRLEVGGRLLVHLLPIRGENDVAGYRAALERGLSQRDADGFNRLRLVLVASDRSALRAAAVAAATLGAEKTDERAHLHVMLSEQVPFLGP